MRAEIIKNKIFTRRTMVVGGIKLALFSTLVGRLYYLQFMKSGEFKTLSEDNHIKLQLVTPPRGRILDRNGVILADNKVNYQLVLDKTRCGGVEETLGKLSRAITVSEEKMEEFRQKIKKSRGSFLVYLEDYLSWDDVAAIEVNRAELAGLEINPGINRDYTQGEKSAHLLGYLGAVSDKDDVEGALAKLPDYRIGKNGVEKQFEESLRGKPGIKKIEVDAHGVAVRELGGEASTAGHDLPLAIDARLQEFAYNALGEETGAIVVMDIKSGEVLTFVSKPGYDPNALSKTIDPDYWKALLEDPFHPFISKCIAGVYPPGSTFKMITALAGLKAGAITPDTTFFCPGYVDLGSHRFHCWKQGGHGTVNLAGAIAQSCDTYFYHTGMKTGIDKLAEMGELFGFGSITGIDLPGEKSGLMPSRAWKKKRFDKPWMQGETLNTAIGQGYMLATPLQLAQMTAWLASRGKTVIPTVLKISEEIGPSTQGKLDIPEEYFEAVLEGMYDSTNTPGGTAYGKRIMDDTMLMAGKTGTAQVKRIVRSGQQVVKEVRKIFKHHAWYTGFAPFDNPRFAVTVLVEHGESGSGAAAPIARDVLIKAQEFILGKKYAYVPPRSVAEEPQEASQLEVNDIEAPETNDTEINSENGAEANETFR